MSINMDDQINENPISEIVVGMKYGCLQVLDNGSEYSHSIDSKIFNVNEEKAEFIKAIKQNKLVQKDHMYWNGGQTIMTPAYVYEPVNFETRSSTIAVDEFDKEISRLLKEKEIKHYKCKCRKCGKIRFYSAYTLQTKPAVCYKPIYCSSVFTYSTRAADATYRKIEKYKNNESVCLVDFKEKVAPSEEYCDKWNESRQKELIKKQKKKLR
jgi:hypothetical protein